MFQPTTRILCSAVLILSLAAIPAYAQEDPIAALAAAGYSNLSPATDYSYVFTGFSGALASASLLPQLAGAALWPTNADEPRAPDYNKEFKSPGQLLSLYSPDAYRASDHDALVVWLQDRRFGLRGDVNRSCEVDIVDLAMIASAWQTTGFDPVLDINRDGVISIVDIMLAASNWGVRCWE